MEIESIAKEAGLHYPMTPLGDDAASEYNRAVLRFAKLIEAVTLESARNDLRVLRGGEFEIAEGNFFQGWDCGVAAAIRALKPSSTETVADA